MSEDWVGAASRASWLSSLFLLAAAVVAYSVWIYRANQSVRATGRDQLDFSPGGSVAVSFVPLVNLVGPYRAVDELRASVAARYGLAVRLWWSLWIASLSWGLASRFVDGGFVAMWRAPVHDGLWTGSALCLVLVVRGIEQGLEREAAIGRSRFRAEAYAQPEAS